MHRSSLAALLLIGACIAPLAATAQTAPQPANSPSAGGGFDVDEAPAAQSQENAPIFYKFVEVGANTQDNGSAMFGRYNGMPDSGTHPTLSAHVAGGDAWDSGKTFFYDLTVDNLTNDSKKLFPGSSISLKFGHRGQWNAGVFFDNISYLQSTTFQTAYNGDGTLAIGTPGGIILTGLALANPPSATATAVSNNAAAILVTRRVGTQRNTVGLSFLDQFMPNWVFSTAYSHEHKTGTKENSALQGSGTGLNSTSGSFTYFAEPVDYDTDKFNAVLAYTTPDLQVRLTYVLSNFKDNKTDIVLIDPFANTNIIAVPRSATYATPPSNWSHQLNAQVGYSLPLQSRISATLGYGMSFQNMTFAPESTNPSVAIPTGIGTSFDGKMRTFFGAFTFTSHPINKLDFKVNYTIDDRDNRSPAYSYKYLLNDTASFGAVTQNAPYSYQYQKASGEVGYRFLPETRATVGYTYEKRWRNYSAVSQNLTDTVFAHINSQIRPELMFTFGVSHEDRKSSLYNGAYAWSVLGDNQSSQVDANGMKHYLEAPRKRFAYNAELSWTPCDTLSASLSGNAYDEKYQDTLYGLTRSRGSVFNGDVNYQPIKTLEAHAFYTFEKTFYQLQDRVTPGGGGAIFYWGLGTPNVVRTYGASAKWQVTKKLSLNGEATYQHGTTAFNEVGNPSGSLGSSPWNYNVVALPSNQTTITNLSLTADYQLQPTSVVSLGWLYQHLKSIDYLNDQTATSPYYANELIGADGTPRYSVNVFRVAYRAKF